MTYYVLLKEKLSKKSIQKQRVFRDRTLLLDITSDDELYMNYRMDGASCFELINLTRPYLERDTQRSMPISPETQVLASLRFFSKGGFYSEIGQLHGISIPSVSRVLHATTEAICESLDNIHFPVTVSEQRLVKEGFHQLAGFPRVLGCIDGTLIPIQGPTGDEEPSYVCRKGYHAINAQAVCDSKLRFLNVVSRWPGATHDATVLSNSALGQHLENTPIDGWLLGDSGYPSRSWLLTPILDAQTRPEERYNSCHCRTRNGLEALKRVCAPAMSTCGEESESWTSEEEDESDSEAECDAEDGGGWDNDFYSYASFQDEESESDYCDTDEEQQQEELTKPSQPPGDANSSERPMVVDSQNDNMSGAAPKDEEQESDDEDMADDEEVADDEEYGGRMVMSEKCLISVTKPYKTCTSSTFQNNHSQGTQTPFDFLCYDDDFCCESEVPDTAWYTLTDLIFNRDGYGIIDWFKNRTISAYTKMEIGTAVDSPLKIAIRAGSVVIFDYLCGQGFAFHPSCHPFFEATKEGSLPHLKRMLDIGVDINISDDENMTALHLAAREPYDYSPIIKFLVSHGADVGQIDEFGATPIFRAVMSGSEENINCLIEAGSPLNKQNFEGRPILHAAVLRGFKMVKRLYRAGARPGTSPVYDEVRAAVRGGHINILRYLIRKNAPLRTKSFKENLTTLCHVITCPDADVGSKMLDMLLAAGYDVSAEPHIEKHVPPQYFRGPRGKSLRRKLDSCNTNLKSLKELSCLKARQALGTSLPDMLKDGAVPPAIKNQLTLKHV